MPEMAWTEWEAVTGLLVSQYGSSRPFSLATSLLVRTDTNGASCLAMQGVLLYTKKSSGPMLASHLISNYYKRNMSHFLISKWTFISLFK